LKGLPGHPGTDVRVGPSFASGAESARAISGACDITREELISVKKIAKVVERVLTTQPVWKV